MLATAGFGYARLWDASGRKRFEVPLTRVVSGRHVATTAVSMDTPTLSGNERVVVADRFKAWIVDPVTGGSTSIVLPASSQSTIQNDVGRRVVVDDTKIALDYQAGTAYLLDVASPERTQQVTTDFPDNLDVALSPDRSRMAISSVDGLAVVSLRGDGLIARRFEIGNGDIAVTRAGSIISRSNLGSATTELWRVTANGVVRVPIIGLRPSVLGITNDDRFAIAVDPAVGVGLIDLPSGRLRTLFPGRTPDDGAFGTVVWPDGFRIAVADPYGRPEPSVTGTR